MNGVKLPMDRTAIMELIPHRDPFLLIDEVLALEPGQSCTARKTMRPDDFWFRGHFPGHPVTPGVLMIEMLAQTGAVCAGSLERNKGKIAFFAKIDDAKFRRQVVPGDVLELRVEMIKMRSMLGVGKGIASVGGEAAVEATLTFMFEK